jgi:hypothetical protein
MSEGHLNIGAVNSQMIAGVHNSQMIAAIRDIAGGLRMKITREIAGDLMNAEIRSIATVRPNSMKSQMIGNIAGGRNTQTIRDIAGTFDRIIAKKRSKSAEVLLFLNSERLTTPWARGHRG